MKKNDRREIERKSVQPVARSPLKAIIFDGLIDDALDELSIAEREILSLRFGIFNEEPLTYIEIGKIFKINIGNAKKRIDTALKKCRRILVRKLAK